MPSRKTLAALGMIACGALLVRCGDDDDEDDVKQPTEPANLASAAETIVPPRGPSMPVVFNLSDLYHR